MNHFTIPAMPWQNASGKTKEVIVGYYARGARPAGGRLKQYVSWREHVRFAASQSGIELPLRAITPRMIYIAAYFANGNHPDVENVRKGVIDALCYVGKEEKAILGPGYGSDKWIGGGHSLPRYDEADPRVEVFILTPEEWKRVFHEEVLCRT